MDSDKRRDRVYDHIDDHPMDNRVDKQRFVVFDILHRQESFSIDQQHLHSEKPEERERERLFNHLQRILTGCPPILEIVQFVGSSSSPTLFPFG